MTHHQSRRRGGGGGVWAGVGLPAAGAAAVVAGWWVATSWWGVAPYVLPEPQAVAAAAARLAGYLAAAAGVTAAETGAGFALAAAGGITLGVVLASSRTVAAAVYPLLVAGHAMPKVALAPALVVALGFGPGPKVVMVVLVCGFPVVLATATGLTRTPVELVELMSSLDASWWHTMAKLRLPAALPQIFVGLRQAAPLAVIGAVVGELFGATAGLGYTIRVAGSDTALTWACLLLLAGLSLALFYLVAGLEKVFAPWVGHTTG